MGGRMTYHREDVGPIAIIICSRPIEVEDAAWVNRTMNAFNVLQWDGGMIRHVIVKSSYQRAQAEVAALQSLLGASLSHEIVLACRRNSQLAHRKLAEISIRLARRFGGVVDLTDTLDDLKQAHTITGHTADGKPFDYHVATPESLQHWLGHPRFRMAC
jgi:hypothetical protein